MLNNKKQYIIDDNTNYEILENEFDEKLSSDCCTYSEFMKENKLTKDEGVHIFAYTGFSSKWINSALRDQNLTSNQEYFMNILDAALNKIPSVSKNKVYRSFFDYNSNKIYFTPGEIISLSHYLSTSKEIFYNPTEVWEITPLSKNSKGRNIEKISNAPDEKEILFLRNSRFKITGSSVKEDIPFYVLKEVE